MRVCMARFKSHSSIKPDLVVFWSGCSLGRVCLLFRVFVLVWSSQGMPWLVVCV
ncbi:hypothetical protein HanIR_Chr02g0074781 [Helianthus annuus]|nr:hypothetical protein HanIR_Chr02g0074781 [Helianthus annuus]